MKLSTILKEILSEVGEGTANTYPFKLDSGGYTFISRYVFKALAGEYEVFFTPSHAYISKDNKVMVDDEFEDKEDMSYEESLEYERDGFLVGFRVVGGDHGDVTNKNEMYKVMATILAIIKVNNNIHNPDYYKFQPAKKNKMDDRRLNLYLAYIKKNIGNEWVVDITDSNDHLEPGEVVYLIRK